MKRETPLRRPQASILSPLRYPGGKRRLVGYISEALRLNSLRPKLYVEPFAGGASVALQLLNDGLVERIALGEKDPLVASFWKVVFSDHEWLVRQVRDVELTLDNWERFRRAQLTSDRERALACLFLNRTSFSGILNSRAGPIGGRSQTSQYTLDCRFPRETIVRRIEQAAALAGRVLFVRERDWTEIVAAVAGLGYGREEVFYYLDPPFYHKAERLYRHAFDESDHVRLHDTLGALDAQYILSYDAAEPIIALYSRNGIGPTRVELLYSATQAGALVKAQELIVTNLPILPQATRLWLTSAEWKRQ